MGILNNLFGNRKNELKKTRVRLNFIAFSIGIFLFTSCGYGEMKIKKYGIGKVQNDSLAVSLKIPEFNDYGTLVDRIREITCNDSIPKIFIERNDTIRNIYPTEYCEPMIFDPKEKHYVTFRGGKAYKANTIFEIDSDSLGLKLTEEFAYYRDSNESEKPESYLVIVESVRSDKVDGIENFLVDLTREFDNLNTKINLNVSFWEVVPHLPPPPALEDSD